MICNSVLHDQALAHHDAGRGPRVQESQSARERRFSASGQGIRNATGFAHKQPDPSSFRVLVVKNSTSERDCLQYSVDPNRRT